MFGDERVKGKSLLWTCLISMLLTAAMTSIAKAPISTRLYIEPAVCSAPPGGTVIVSVNIADVTGLFAHDIKITYDPAILYTDTNMIDEGPFLSQGGTYPTGFATTVTALYIGIGNMLLTATSTSGSGTLATITFNVQAEGTCALDITYSDLRDASDVPIPHTVESGYFSNIVIGDLVGKSAWPEHHHFSISGDEDNIQEVFGKVTNTGDGEGYIRVQFTLWQTAGPQVIVVAKYLVGDVETRIAPGQTVIMSAKLWEAGYAWEPGKYYVNAVAMYSASGTTWTEGLKTKAFSFAIVL